MKLSNSKYNWSKVPEWVNWIATNEGGFAFGTEGKPIRGWLLEGFWYLGGKDIFLFWPSENPFKDDWKNSLEQRPKEALTCEFKEFKVGDKVIWTLDDPWQWDVNAIHEIKEHSHGQFKVYLGDEFICWCGDQVFWQEFRHATPEELAAGHRIYKASEVKSGSV